MNQRQKVKGTEDVLPKDTPLWQWLENKIKLVMHQYGYQEVRLPILEPVSLFKRAVGGAKEMISKEMYHFHDESGEHITLRPEGTIGCVRTVIENNLCANKTQRLWYQGPMFRYEQPEQEKLCQFTQFGIEAFGMAGPDIDAELIYIMQDILKTIGVDKQVHLTLNSLGTLATQQAHQARLIDYFTQHQAQLDAMHAAYLAANQPLRILNSQQPALRPLIEAAPKLLDYLDHESHQHFLELCKLLDNANIRYTINPLLFFGLDYYTKTVFQWSTQDDESSQVICSGGRYDGLVELFGKKNIPATGFAIGTEQLLQLVQHVGDTQHIGHAPDIIVTYEGTQHNITALLLAHYLREHLHHYKVFCDCRGANLPYQRHQAYHNGCRYMVTVNPEGELFFCDFKLNKSEILSQLEIVEHMKQQPK